MLFGVATSVFKRSRNLPENIGRYDTKVGLTWRLPVKFQHGRSLSLEILKKK
jgi:hypothetical protein